MADPDTSAFINFVANITSAAAATAATTPTSPTSTSPPSTALPHAPMVAWGCPAAPVFTPSLTIPQLTHRRSPANKLPSLPSMSPLSSSIQQQQQQQQLQKQQEFHFKQQPQPFTFNPGLVKITPSAAVVLPPKSSRRHQKQHLPNTVQVKVDPSAHSGPLTPLTSASPAPIPAALMSKMILPNIKPMPFHMDKSLMEDDTISKLKQLKKYRESHNEGNHRH